MEIKLVMVMMKTEMVIMMTMKMVREKKIKKVMIKAGRDRSSHRTRPNPTYPMSNGPKGMNKRDDQAG